MSSRDSLTKKQAKLLAVYSDYGLWRPPSMKDMVALVGLASNRSLIDMRALLVKKGYLVKRGNIYEPRPPLPLKDFSPFRYRSGGTS